MKFLTALMATTFLSTGASALPSPSQIANEMTEGHACRLELISFNRIRKASRVAVRDAGYDLGTSEGESAYRNVRNLVLTICNTID